MSKEPHSSIPADLVERSLSQAVEFARSVLPLLKTACEYVAHEVTLLPPGAARHTESELQCAPAMIRMRMHQLIQGHNMKCIGGGGGTYINRKHIRNGAICLLFEERQFRMLKASKKHPTRPSGYYQQALITQQRYYDLISKGSLFPELNQPLLNGLIYYYFTNFELRGAYVAIPDGFLHGRVNILKQAMLQAYSESDLEDLARFEATGTLNVLEDNEALILSEAPIEAAAVGDPFAEAEIETSEPEAGVEDLTDVTPVVADEESIESQS